MMRSMLLIALALLFLAINVTGAQAQARRRRSTQRRTPRETAAQQTPPLPAAATLAATTTPSGLTYLVTRSGQGRQPRPGEIVVVHYTGTLTSGLRFDSSLERGDPIAFKLGAGRVIKGWDEGIAQLHVGDRAILIIPPQLGYGSKGAGGVIPPDATLIFIIEVMDVKATSLSETLSQTLQERGVEAMIAQYRELTSKGLRDVYVSEADMNAWGYRLLSNNQPGEAIEVFKLNVAAYPNSANAYDSLAEGYLVRGDKQLAIDNYRKALELNPQLESARKALAALTGN